MVTFLGWWLCTCVFVLGDCRTALHVAACENHARVCEVLVQAGADVLKKDRCG